MIAEGLWISSRSEVYGCTPMLVAIAVGLDPAVGMLLVPLVGVVTGFGFACFGITVAAVVSTIENFNYIVSAVLTPLFLVAGTFFPIEGLPQWAQIAAELNPLHHCVELVRHCVFGFEPGTDVLRLLALVLFAVLLWRVAINRMQKRLID